MDSSVLQRSGDFRREQVAGDPDDEQLAEVGVEEQLRRHPRVAAADDSRERVLGPGQIRRHVLLDDRETRLAAQ
jgi:hypothetical protein